MSITLTQLASDNFQRANVSPLSSPWALDIAGDPGLQIVSDLCEAINDLANAVQIYDYAGGTPDDQYASFTRGGSSGYEMVVACRLTDNGATFGEGSNMMPGYQLRVVGTTDWLVYSPASGFILTGFGQTNNIGDVFTLAVVGNEISVFQNGTLLGSVINNDYSSGKTGLATYSNDGVTSAQYSNFAMGKASAPLSITTNTLPDGHIGSPYSATLAANGGTTPYSWSISSGRLPTGLSLDASTGVISGTPSEGGNFGVTARVTDTSSPATTVTKSFGFDVLAGGGGGPMAGGWNEYARVVQQQQRPANPLPDWRRNVGKG